jgi:lipoate-protein ligase A
MRQASRPIRVRLQRLLQSAALPATDGTSARLDNGADLRRGAVILSSSHDIYENLAIEEALASGCRFAPPLSEAAPSAVPASKVIDVPGACGPLLFVYRNNPCVVIGCNQIPWRELNVPALAWDGGSQDGIRLARRHSGGGTVFHDLGNVCLSFLTHRADHNPAANMAWLADFLSAACSVERERFTSTYRHDLFVDGKKISGSAMKLTRAAAYHHCTLLVNTDLSTVGRALYPVAAASAFTDSPCVESVRSPVINLESISGGTLRGDGPDDSFRRCERFTETLADAWARRTPGAKSDSTPAVPVLVVDGSDAVDTVFFDVKPRQAIEMNVSAMIRTDRTWEWLFGHTSRFTWTSVPFPAPPLVFPDTTLTIKVVVKYGVIDAATCTATTKEGGSPTGEMDIFTTAVESALLQLPLRQDAVLERGGSKFADELDTESGRWIAADAAAALSLWEDITRRWNAVSGWWKH